MVKKDTHEEPENLEDELDGSEESFGQREFLKMTFTGKCPLIMNSEQSVNVLDPRIREKQGISKKRNKTDDDLEELARMDWHLAIYHAEDIGPYIPGLNVEACLRAGALMEKRGEDVKRGVTCVEDKVPLKYKGPRELKTMWESRKFIDIRSVVIQRRRVMKCRPIFQPGWSISFTLAYDVTIFNPHDLIRIAGRAGEYKGICDFRPRYGRFTVSE